MSQREAGESQCRTLTPHSNTSSPLALKYCHTKRRSQCFHPQVSQPTTASHSICASQPTTASLSVCPTVSYGYSLTKLIFMPPSFLSPHYLRSYRIRDDFKLPSSHHSFTFLIIVDSITFSSLDRLSFEIADEAGRPSGYSINGTVRVADWKVKWKPLEWSHQRLSHLTASYPIDRSRLSADRNAKHLHVPKAKQTTLAYANTFHSFHSIQSVQ